MSRLIKVLTMTLVLATMLLVSVTGAVFAEKVPDGIVVSPNYLNVDSYSSYAHIHTDIKVAYGYTDLKVTVNDVNIEGIGLGVDALGYLVVKFDIDQVKEIVEEPDPVTNEVANEAEFVLTCNYDGSLYYESDTVEVIRTP